jgi:hypothetical protein
LPPVRKKLLHLSSILMPELSRITIEQRAKQS